MSQVLCAAPLVCLQVASGRRNAAASMGWQSRQPRGRSEPRRRINKFCFWCLGIMDLGKVFLSQLHSSCCSSAPKDDPNDKGHMPPHLKQASRNVENVFRHEPFKLDDNVNRLLTRSRAWQGSP